MTVLPFAWRSLVRQPARSMLGILGVAAVGALLLDMLLLSEGLVLSMRDLFDRMGFDIRILATDQLPGGSPDIEGASKLAAKIEGLPSVRSALTIRTEDAGFIRGGTSAPEGSLIGVGSGSAPPWTVLRGRDPHAPRELVLNAYAAGTLDAEPGATITVEATCARGAEAPPPLPFMVVGVVELPFEALAEPAAGTTAAGLAEACGTPEADLADFLAVTSAGDADAAAAEIATLGLNLRTFTNEQALGQLEQGGFTYFRQISTVLTTITVSFALLLITVLLTVSVNQRLGEVAALRALGFSRNRVVLDVLCEAALIVGIGGLLSLPLGGLLAVWLDGILKRMPGIPAQLHFFVFQPSALIIHSVLLLSTAVAAALYPMRIVARLPIAATLRNEVTS
jgi:putative ABC transport system permease protein